MQETAIKLKKVSKKYIVHHEKPTLVENITSRKKEEGFWALRDIDLTIKKGERIGIVGPNGSGKTTLLKIIAGITTSTSGSVSTEGKIVSLIELQAGFHPDLTGEENIYLNGLLLGMSRDEVKSRLKEIISFADIGKFIDAPLYMYSEGMKLRLGLSVAVHANPDILVLDEGLTIGDKWFQKKTQKKLKEFFRQRKTVIIVSHWLEFLEKNCDKIINLDKGKIVAKGNTKILLSYKN